ncbi:MAG: Amuc_1100 family pilus-like protein [Verrucomicrobia bacterium]|nr:Amuc_1100 family pilus-like protein [Verrucomicrobiota bacterium]
MSWFKENPILSVALLVCLLIAGAIAYFASEAASTYQAAHDSLTSQINAFSLLQKKSPYPTEKNLGILTASRDKYAEAFAGLKATILKMEAPLEPVSPQEFQDKLREGVNDLSKTAKEKNIKLPEKFFFGFDEYQSQLPAPEAASALNRDFNVLQKLLISLLSLPVEAINSLEREAPPVATPTPTPAPKKSVETTPPPKTQILKTTFKLSFTASQDKTRAAINMIPKSDAFLIIRSLTMENTKPTAPAKKDPAIPSKDKNPTSLQVLLGNESVKTDLSLEIIDFPTTDTEPPNKQ